MCWDRGWHLWASPWDLHARTSRRPGPWPPCGQGRELWLCLSSLDWDNSCNCGRSCEDADVAGRAVAPADASRPDRVARASAGGPQVADASVAQGVPPSLVLNFGSIAPVLTTGANGSLLLFLMNTIIHGHLYFVCLLTRGMSINLRQKVTLRPLFCCRPLTCFHYFILSAWWALSASVLASSWNLELSVCFQ